MRVLFLSQIVPYPPHGGVLQRGYNLIRELGRQAQVHLMAFVHPDVLTTDAEVQRSRAALEESCDAVEYFPLWPKTSRVHRLIGFAASAVSSQPFSVLAHRSVAFQRRVAEVVSSRQYDIIHVDTIGLTQFLDLTWDIPTVVTHHNIESQLMERRAHVQRGILAKWFLKRETRKLVEYEASMTGVFDVNICVSETDEHTLLQRVRGLCTAVVPNGVDIEYFSLRPDSGEPSLIHSGGMNSFANSDAVLYFLDSIWPLIRAKVPNVRFYAVGQSPPSELCAFAKRDSQVIVTGYVPDIRPLVQRASVYVVPLRVGGGTRLKVLDAMAMGKAMVSTSIGCEGLDVQPDKHLQVADTPEEFAEKTVQLLQDQDRRRVLGRAARALVESRYSWQTIGSELLIAYRLAIQERKRKGG